MKRAEMKLSNAILWAGFFVLALSAFMYPSQCHALDASINISPNIINLESTEHAFGIHTNVSYAIVNIDEVLLVCPEDSVLYPIVCYADSHGNLVAKFNTSDLKADCELIVDDYNTLVLEGETKAEPIDAFSAAGEVLIIAGHPKFQKGDGPKNNQGNGAKNKQNKNCQDR